MTPPEEMTVETADMGQVEVLDDGTVELIDVK